MISLDLQRLRCFLAVAEEKNFGRAAKRLNVTAAPLSRQVKQLEKELGGDLFVRAYHDVTLTPFGASLLDLVRTAVDAVDAVGSAAERLRVEGVPLRVGATPYAPTPFLDSFLEELRRGAFAIDNEVLLGHGTTELARRLKLGALDLALVHLPSPDESLDSMLWKTYRLALAVRSDDPLARRDSVTLEDLAGRHVIHPLARLHAKMMDVHRAQLEAAGITDIDTSDVLGGAEIATHVWSRRLISFVPDVPGSLLGRVFGPPQFAIIPVTGAGLTMSVGIVWSPRQAATSPLLQRALLALRDAAGRD